MFHREMTKPTKRSTSGTTTFAHPPADRELTSRWLAGGIPHVPAAEACGEVAIRVTVAIARNTVNRVSAGRDIVSVVSAVDLSFRGGEPRFYSADAGSRRGSCLPARRTQPPPRDTVHVAIRYWTGG